VYEQADIMADNLTETELRENIAGQAIISLSFHRFITSRHYTLSSFTVYRTTFGMFLIYFLEIIKNGDLATLTSKKIRKILEKKYDVNLLHR
jgi:hypothetical protein